jgi:hypothetical protein
LRSEAPRLRKKDRPPRERASLRPHLLQHRLGDDSKVPHGDALLSAILISDPETVVLVERLAETLGSNKTAAVNCGVHEALERRGQPTAVELPKPRGGVKAEIEARLRRETREYVKLREKVTGKKSGTRIYRTLSDDRDPIKTITRLIMKGPTEGLQFLVETRRLDLAAENIVIDYKDLFPADVIERAQANLTWAREIKPAATMTRAHAL